MGEVAIDHPQDKHAHLVKVRFRRKHIKVFSYPNVAIVTRHSVIWICVLYKAFNVLNF